MRNRYLVLLLIGFVLSSCTSEEHIENDVDIHSEEVVHFMDDNFYLHLLEPLPFILAITALILMIGISYKVLKFKQDEI